MVGSCSYKRIQFLVVASSTTMTIGAIQQLKGQNISVLAATVCLALQPPDAV